MTPIYATSTYAQESPGVNKGYRVRPRQEPDARGLRAPASPTWRAAARASASPRAWRRPRRCWSCWTPASHVVAGDDLYGGTCRLFERVRRRSMGLDFSLRRLHRPGGRRGGDHRRRRRCCGSRRPTNPMLKLADLAALSAHRARRTACSRSADNTFATPCVPAAAGARLRRGHALGDQVPERPLRHDRRRAGGGERRDLADGDEVPAELGRRGDGPVRQPSWPTAGPEDPGAAHEAPLRERPGDRALAGGASTGVAQVYLSGPEQPSAARAGASGR